MKELQDQFEAEQYFSVSFCSCLALGKRLNRLRVQIRALLPPVEESLCSRIPLACRMCAPVAPFDARSLCLRLISQSVLWHLEGCNPGSELQLSAEPVGWRGGAARECVVSISLLFALQTLYKTQVRELKEECEEKNKLYKEVQQSLQDQQEER